MSTSKKPARSLCYCADPENAPSDAQIMDCQKHQQIHVTPPIVPVPEKKEIIALPTAIQAVPLPVAPLIQPSATTAIPPSHPTKTKHPITPPNEKKPSSSKEHHKSHRKVSKEHHHKEEEVQKRVSERRKSSIRENVLAVSRNYTVLPRISKVFGWPKTSPAQMKFHFHLLEVTCITSTKTHCR